MMDPQLQIVRAEEGTLRVVGELDMATVPLFVTAVREAFEANGSVTLDLAELSFIDSSGLAALAKQATELNDGAPLSLVNVPPFTRRLLEIVGLDKSDTLVLA